MNFAEKLRQARLDAGLSQQQLADKFNPYKNGKRRVKKKTTDK